MGIHSRLRPSSKEKQSLGFRRFETGWCKRCCGWCWDRSLKWTPEPTSQTAGLVRSSPCAAAAYLHRRPYSIFESNCAWTDTHAGLPKWTRADRRQSLLNGLTCVEMGREARLVAFRTKHSAACLRTEVFGLAALRYCAASID